MIEINERITRVTTRSDATTPVAAGARVTLEFNRSVPLTAGQAVRVRYDFTGNGGFLDCVGIAQATHIVARRGHLVIFHYRLSHWITAATLSRIREMHPGENRGSEFTIELPCEPSTAMIPEPVGEEPAVDRSPV